MKKTVLAFCVASSLALSACNTIAGMGEDLSTVGDSIEDTAEDAKN